MYKKGLGSMRPDQVFLITPFLFLFKILHTYEEKAINF